MGVILNIFRRLKQWFREYDNISKTSGTQMGQPDPVGVEQPTKREGVSGPVVFSKVLESPTSNTAAFAANSVRWVSHGETPVVAGRNIGGMIYLGPDQRVRGFHRGIKPFILPTLPIAGSRPNISGDDMPYWPGYSDITPNARAAYLDWLATGRSDTRYGVGYVFLYFYGLERRFFVDSPDLQERLQLISEVDRLLQIYGENRSVRRYFEVFLDAARASVGPDGELEPRYCTAVYELPLGLRVTIGRKAGQGQSLDADWLLSWYFAHPDYTLRTAASRAFLEFHTLFRELFNERYPSGLKIPLPKRAIRFQYHAASSEFEVDLEEYIGTVPDISRITQPLNVARTLVDDATNALDKYSRFLGRNPGARGTVEAHALLPEKLWPLFPNAEMENLRIWAEEVIDAGGLSPVETVIQRLGGAVSETVGKRQLTDASDALARLSVGMAPDPRFALRSPRVGEQVVLFHLPEGVTQLDAVSGKYKSILIKIAIGSFVAHADEAFEAQEIYTLEAAIYDDPELSQSERFRLRANLKWMTSVKPDLSLLRRHLRDTPRDASYEIGQVALAVAAADGVISGKEVSALERLYKVIGLNTDGIYSALHALASGSGPVTIIPATEGERGFALPSRPAPDCAVILDAEKVASVMANTARVSSILGQIFQEEESEDDDGEDIAVLGHEFGGLDEKHSAFLGELITRPHWDVQEYNLLASQFRLLPQGAVETVNEWSFNRFGDLLIEEGDGFSINSEVSSEILTPAE